MAKEVLNYFLQNPQAVDSLRGIARWRLLEQVVRQTVDTTDTAVRFLVARGFLKMIPLPDSEPVFQLNPEKRIEAERFADERDTSRPTRHS